MGESDSFISRGNNEDCFQWLQMIMNPWTAEDTQNWDGQPSSHNRRQRRGTGCSKLRDDRRKVQNDWLRGVTEWGTLAGATKWFILPGTSPPLDQGAEQLPVSVQSTLGAPGMGQGGGTHRNPHQTRFLLWFPQLTSKGRRNSGSWQPVIV